MNQTTQIFTQLDTTLSSLIGNLGLIKTLEMLKEFDKGLPFFLPQNPQTTTEKLHDFILHSLAQHAQINKNLLLTSSKHYHSDLRKIAFVLLFEFGLKVPEIAKLYSRDNRFVAKNINDMIYLLTSKHANIEFKTLYDRLTSQINTYRSIRNGNDGN